MAGNVMPGGCVTRVEVVDDGQALLTPILVVVRLGATLSSGLSPVGERDIVFLLSVVPHELVRRGVQPPPAGPDVGKTVGLYDFGDEFVLISVLDVDSPPVVAVQVLAVGLSGVPVVLLPIVFTPREVIPRAPEGRVYRYIVGICGRVMVDLAALRQVPDRGRSGTLRATPGGAVGAWPEALVHPCPGLDQ